LSSAAGPPAPRAAATPGPAPASGGVGASAPAAASAGALSPATAADVSAPSGTTGAAASTQRLLQLCVGYFGAYVLTGLVVKIFTGGIRQPRMTDMAFLANNTLGSMAACVIAVIALGWLGIRSARTVRWFGVEVPWEARFIIPSGICTAVIIPGTTLLYALPISVMVAMVIMRGSVIVISRLVDAVQIRQGILKRQVYREEDWAVVFALAAVATNVLLVPIVHLLAQRGITLPGLSPKALSGAFDFVHSGLAMTVLGAYIVAYGVRLYIMNFYKNTRASGNKFDNRAFFAVEQIAASVTVLLAVIVLALGPRLMGWSELHVVEVSDAIRHPDFTAWLSGLPFGAVAFFSVFLFLFPGRTATFAGLVNRLTSLLAGTVSTLILAWAFGLKPPGIADWVSFGFICVAVLFLWRAEERRRVELGARSA
jgi:hypothetical protein